MKNKFVKNLSWIFLGNVVHAIFQFLINILAARVFSTNDYGIMNYAASLIAFFSSVSTLGIGYIIAHNFSQHEEKVGNYLWSGILARIAASIISIIALQVIVRVSSPEEGILYWVVLCQSLTIFAGSFDLIQYWYRYKSKANVIAIVRLIAFFGSALWRVLVLCFFPNIISYIIGATIESFAFAGILLFIYKRDKQPKLLFRWDTLKSMLHISYPFIFSAILGAIYGQTDKIMLKSMLDNEAVAHYSAALTLAGAISIVPVALIDGFRPEVMRSKQQDAALYQKRMRQLFCIVFWLCTAYCLGIMLLSKPIILFLYGVKYAPAIQPLSVVVWYTAYSYFGAINSIYMVAEGKSAFVQLTTLFGAALNIILNMIMIPAYGVIGAALASLITQFATNFALPAAIPSLRPCFKMMVEGILFIDTFPTKKRLKKN